MKFLVTGANGQLGREWLHHLPAWGDRVRGFGSEDLDITKAGPLYRKLDGLNPDWVINCAGYTDVDGAEKDRNTAFRVNEQGVRNLAEWCNANGAGLVHFSTDYVFPGRIEDRETWPDGYSEEARTDPQNTYGMSKRAGEEAMASSCAGRLLIRISWLCGRYGNNFVKTMLRLAAENRPLKVVHDQYGSPSYAPNVVLNTRELIRQQKNGTWHIASKGVITWYEFAEAIFREAGVGASLSPVSSEEFQRPAARPGWSKLDTRKLGSVKSCKVIDWREGLRELIRELEPNKLY